MSATAPVYGGNWREHAACRTVHTAVFFGDSDSVIGDDDVAKHVCAGCPVREPCRADGERETFGVWGGTSSEDRGFVTSVAFINRFRPTDCLTATSEVMESRAQQWFTFRTLHTALGGRWNYSSVRSALRTLHRRGRLERRGGGRNDRGQQQPLEYRWAPDDHETGAP